MATERKGLRFEVAYSDDKGWNWTLVGADGPVAISPKAFDTEKDCRSHIHASKGRLKSCGFAKVITVLDEDGNGD